MLVDSSVVPHGYAKWIALVLFCVASITDFLDGQIARRNNLVTNFGKFMDPLADKILTCSMPAWIVIIIIAREFVISGFRLVASDKGVVIAASYWGKFKTNFQMFAIILLIADFGGPVAFVIEQILVYIALILTIVSLVDYLAKNIDVLKEGGEE